MNASQSVTVNTATFTTYTKVANNGVDLPDSAQLGSAASDWACTRTNSSFYSAGTGSATHFVGQRASLTPILMLLLD